MNILKRIVNESLTIAVIIGGILHVVGADPELQEQAQNTVQAVLALVGALIVRGGIDGPVTRREENS